MSRAELTKLANQIADILENDTPTSDSPGLAVTAYVQMGMFLRKEFETLLGSGKPTEDPKRLVQNNLSEEARTHNRWALSTLFQLMQPIVGGAFVDRDGNTLMRRDLSEWWRPRALPETDKEGMVGQSARALDRLAAREAVYILTTYEAGRLDQTVAKTRRQIFDTNFSDEQWRKDIKKPFLAQCSGEFGCFLGEPNEKYWKNRGRGKTEPHPYRAIALLLAEIAKGKVKRPTDKKGKNPPTK